PIWRVEPHPTAPPRHREAVADALRRPHLTRRRMTGCPARVEVELTERPHERERRQPPVVAGRVIGIEHVNRRRGLPDGKLLPHQNSTASSMGATDGLPLSISAKSAHATSTRGETPCHDCSCTLVSTPTPASRRMPGCLANVAYLRTSSCR